MTTSYTQEHKDKEFHKRLKSIYDIDPMKKVFTPFVTLGKEIIDKLPNVDGEILVLSDLGLLRALLQRFKVEGKDMSSITFTSNQFDQVEFARAININSIQIGYNEPIEELERLMSKKFDVIVGNPPYLDGLHMKLLQKGFQLLEDDGHLIFVQPSTCFTDRKITKRKSENQSIVDVITDHVQSMDFINGNKIFDIGLFAPLAITVISKNKRVGSFPVNYLTGETVNYSSINEISHHHQVELVRSLMNKFKDVQTLELYKRVTEKVEKNYIVHLARIRGNVSDTLEYVNSDFYTFFSSKIKVNSLDEIKKMEKNCNNLFEFDSINEGENFIKYLKTNFARRALSLLKTGSSVDRGELAMVPYLDFTREWTDEKLFEHFNLNKEEIDFVNAIPNYY